MGKKIAGIDISSTAVKVAVVDKIDSENNIRVVAAAVANLREGSVHAGEIKSVPAVAAAISETLKQLGASRLPVIIGAAHPDIEVYPREMHRKVPKHRRVVALESSSTRNSTRIPSADAVRSVCEYLPGLSASEDEEMVRLSVAETRRSELKKIEEIITLAKLNALAVDLAAAGTMRPYTNASGHMSDAALLVDIGASTTKVISTVGPYIHSLDCLTIGGSHVTKALTTAGMSREDAEAFKRNAKNAARHAAPQQTSGYGAEDDSEERNKNLTDYDSAMLNAVNHLASQIASSVRSPKMPSGLNAIGLAGMASGTVGLVDALKKRTGIETVGLWRPRIEVARNKKTAALFNADGNIMTGPLVSLATAAGLAAGGLI